MDDDSRQLLPESSFVTSSSDNTVRFWCLEPTTDQWNMRNIYSKVRMCSFTKVMITDIFNLRSWFGSFTMTEVTVVCWRTLTLYLVMHQQWLIPPGVYDPLPYMPVASIWPSETGRGTWGIKFWLRVSIRWSESSKLTETTPVNFSHVNNLAILKTIKQQFLGFTRPPFMIAMGNWFLSVLAYQPDMCYQNLL